MVATKVAKKYDSAKVELFIGVISKSFLAPEILSCTISILEQKATVTQLTASNDDVSCPATTPFISVSGQGAPLSEETNESL